jgi:hypothetical protein
MALGKVRVPSFAPWWRAAETELLKFPAYRHDDFVDFMGLIGRGIDYVRGAREVRPKFVKIAPPLTGKWLLRLSGGGHEEAQKVRHYCSV